MNKPCIVVIAYNRAEPLRRLLASLSKADYSASPEGVKLIISIDKSDLTDVYETAKAFEWSHGEKIIKTHEERMGLKAHVLECSANAISHGSAIILEDDLCVSEGFYTYACSALSHSEKDERVAGVSLYNHRLNVHVREPFEAIDDGYDNYYFQFASSWGQAFTKEQWSGFIEWLEGASNYTSENGAAPDCSIPSNVANWGEKSWLRLFIIYMIKTNKYFLYPRVSLSTNFSEEGTHKMGNAADLQVPLLYGIGKEWRFSDLEESKAVYDSFFENEYIADKLIEDQRVIVDVYGGRDGYEGSDYLLSSRALPYEMIKSYGCVLRPVETNALNGIEGEEIFLYNLRKAGKAPRITKAKRLLYNYRAFKAKYGLEIIRYRLK